MVIPRSGELHDVWWHGFNNLYLVFQCQPWSRAWSSRKCSARSRGGARRVGLAALSLSQGPIYKIELSSRWLEQPKPGYQLLHQPFVVISHQCNYFQITPRMCPGSRLVSYVRSQIWWIMTVATQYFRKLWNIRPDNCHQVTYVCVACGISASGILTIHRVPNNPSLEKLGQGDVTTRLA